MHQDQIVPTASQNDMATEQMKLPGREKRLSFSQILEIQRHDREQMRVVHHWTGSSPGSEDIEMSMGVGRVVAGSIPDFFKSSGVRVHYIDGIRGCPPRYRSEYRDASCHQIPQDVIYFVEDADKGERFVLEVETDRSGDMEFRIYSSVASIWFTRIFEFVRDNNYLRGKVFDLDGKKADIGEISLDDVVLTHKQQELIQRHVIGYAQRLAELVSRGARGQRGVLLEGVPGCGKSMLIKGIANTLSEVSVCIAGPDQISRYGSVDALEQFVRLTAPCVVVIEEIDIFGADRRIGGGVGMAERMQLMDGLRSVQGVLWLATTNRPEVVEQALADRPGRFDRRVKFGPLPLGERTRLMEQLVMPCALSDDGLDLAVKLTDGMTGAQMRELAETLRILFERDVYSATDVEQAWEDWIFDRGSVIGFSCR
tara:strand:+ start:13102 stop:14379 length:1278 start_codon:yes stop_codon:yes gene_type:complete